ncbi:S1C family serine protease [Phosphitispora sp. TUW77]|uniref:S1C family serine protease n=1 Tax=Phosphitispora sp. TUW77 TaxID=3152361 RepID=UPI003AB3E85F
MVKFKERFSLPGVIIISFLMGIMFMAGGLTAYKLYFPPAVVAEDGNNAANTNNAADGNNIKLVSIGPTDISQTVKNVSPAVVNIESFAAQQSQMNPYMNDPLFREFFGRNFDYQPYPETSTGIGTGFIFDKSGLIITNEHVINGSSKIEVTINGFDEPLSAEVIGSDEELDLAVLKVSVKKDLPVLKMGDSNKTEVGSWVIAIGNPYGLDHTVTVGVISAKGRPLQISNRMYKNLLQTDAAINPGNSGGPLLNTAGEVIGINTAINSSAQGIGFAIPAATVKEVLEDLVNNGKVTKPYIGVYLQSVNKELADYFGAYDTDGAVVAYVVPGSPAEKAGILKGDIIVKIDKQKVKTPEDITEKLKNIKIGDNVAIQVFRKAAIKTITVKIGEKP